MIRMLIVQKYGGSSLADEKRLCMAARRVAGLVKRGHKLVVVVSAQGDTKRGIAYLSVRSERPLTSLFYFAFCILHFHHAISL